MRLTQRLSPALRRSIIAVVALSTLATPAIVAVAYLRDATDVVKANPLNALPGVASGTPNTGIPQPVPASSGPVAPSAAASTGGSATPTPGPKLPAAFPNADNTGVPSGAALKPMKGEIVVRENGTVIDGVDLVGRIAVEADNVTIKRSRITAPKNLPNQGRDEFTVIQQATKATGLTMEDCEVDGSGLVYRAIMAFERLTVNRCELRNIGHGVEVGGNYTVRNSWIHSTTDGPDHDWHVDGIISGVGVNGLIEHNTIVLTGGSLTGAVAIGGSLGRVDNVVIRGNLLAGGNYTVYIEDQQYGTTRVQMLDNRFSTMVQPKVGVYGIWYGTRLPKDLVRRGNVIHESGAPADEEPDWR